MTLQPRDRRALAWLAVSVVLMVGYRLATRQSGTATSAAAPETVPMAERRLAILRQKAATVPGKEVVLKEVRSELLQRERGLLGGDTAAQAQAQLLAIAQRVAGKQTPPIEIRQTSFADPRPFGDAYGEVWLSLSFECRMDQVVNFLTDLTAQPETVATSDLDITAANPKQKTVQVRMTLAGIVPKRLVPVKKGLTAF